MKRIISLILCILCLISLSSCGMQRKIKRFIPDERIISVEIQTFNYETGVEKISEKYDLTKEQSDEIILLLNEITYVKRYNLLKEKWTHVNDVKYIFTFENQKIILSENHIFIYDTNDTLVKHVEFNSSTFGDCFELINRILN